jgi:hypothetical protein
MGLLKLGKHRAERQASSVGLPKIPFMPAIATVGNAFIFKSRSNKKKLLAGFDTVIYISAVWKGF